MVLKEAQAHGYAEADPTLDIEGIDSAHKLQILATLAFRTAVDLKDIYTEGITAVTQQDVVNARELGYRIKLLAIAKAAEGALEARVHPTMIPAGSPMAAVSGVFNAVFITGDNVGNLMFYGRGAGQLPDRLRGAGRTRSRSPGGSPTASPRSTSICPSIGRAPLPLRPMDDDPLGLLPARDGPGPARRARPGGGHPRASTTSRSSPCSRRSARAREAVPVVMMTHEARERDMRAALAAIDKLPVVAGRTTMIRVEA